MRSQRGSGTILVIVMAGLVATVGVASSSIGLLYVGVEKAAVAAEAAALAAAVATYPPASISAPREAAREIAERNGAALELCSCEVDWSLRARTVMVVAAVGVAVPIFGEVVVRRGARAEFDPSAWLWG